MNKVGRRLVIVVSVIVVLIVLAVINFFVYPFQSAKPNFADVERVFNKIEIPADWVEISSSENRGIAGRACPIESSGCFSKGKRFTLAAGYEVSSIGAVYETSGCPTASIEEHEVIDGDDYASFECSIEGLNVVGDLDKTPGSMWEVSLYVRT